MSTTVVGCIPMRAKPGPVPDCWESSTVHVQVRSGVPLVPKTYTVDWEGPGAAPRLWDDSAVPEPGGYLLPQSGIGVGVTVLPHGHRVISAGLGDLLDLEFRDSGGEVIRTMSVRIGLWNLSDGKLPLTLGG